MSYDVTIEEVPDMLVAAIRTRATMATVGKEIEEAFARLTGFVMPVGFGTGMPGVVMYDQPPDGLDDEVELEIVMPIRAAAEPRDGIQVRVLEGGRVASTLHRGPYDQVGSAYAALSAWIPEHRHDVVGPPREFYLNDPREVGEDAAVTEVQFPIA